MNPATPKSPDEQKGGQEGSGESSSGDSGNGQSSSGQGGNNDFNPSEDYVKGWNQALEDYKNGKIKL